MWARICGVGLLVQAGPAGPILLRGDWSLLLALKARHPGDAWAAEAEPGHLSSEPSVPAPGEVVRSPPVPTCCPSGGDSVLVASKLMCVRAAGGTPAHGGTQ